jgi:hypothetical protein
MMNCFAAKADNTKAIVRKPIRANLLIATMMQIISADASSGNVSLKIPANQYNVAQCTSSTAPLFFS